MADEQPDRLAGIAVAHHEVVELHVAVDDAGVSGAGTARFELGEEDSQVALIG